MFVFALADSLLVAHGEIFHLLSSLIATAVLIGLAIVNGAIAIPLGMFLGWRLFRSKTKRFRFVFGSVVAVITFLSLCFAELVALLAIVDVPKP